MDSNFDMLSGVKFPETRGALHPRFRIDADARS